MSRLPVPNVQGMHDCALLMRCREAMVGAFLQAQRDPAQQWKVDHVHRGNVDQLGWHDAEVLRAEAFADAMALPVGTVRPVRLTEGISRRIEGLLQPMLTERDAFRAGVPTVLLRNEP